MGLEGLPETPARFTVITGEEERVEQTIESFFGGILDFLGYNHRARTAFVKIEAYTLGVEHPGHLQPTDDRITLLIARDITLASVLARRNEFNWIEVLSACYLTSNEMVDRLRDGLVVQ